MGTGAVIQATGRRRLTELGGLARTMPATFGLYMIGALSISGAPLLNGFVSKPLVLTAAEQSHREVVVALLTLRLGRDLPQRRPQAAVLHIRRRARGATGHACPG